MNKAAKRPWSLSFSYGRALQNTCIKTWGGDDANFTKAQEALMVRAKANSEATLGKFVADENDKSGQESLIVENYVY